MGTPGTPSPFEVARGIGNRFGAAMQRQDDRTALDDILENASRTNDPNAVNDAMSQILSRVSPAQQEKALQVLQFKAKNIQAQKEKEREIQTLERTRQASVNAGFDPDLPTPLAKTAYEEKQKQNRLNEIYGKQPSSPQNIDTGSPISSNPFEQFDDNKLITLTGARDKEISEPAKQELKRRQEEKKSSQSQFEPEADKLEAKRVSELATEVEKEFSAAQNENMRLERQLQLDKEGNVSAPSLVKVLDAFGVPLAVLGNPATEEYRKLEADYVRDVSKVFPDGKITNYEISSYMKTIPSLMNTPEGRANIIRNRKLMNEAKKVRYDEYKKILKENGGKKPQNLGILLEERTQDKISKIEDQFISGVQDTIDKFQTPIRMYDPEGKPVDIPPNQIERAIKAGAKFK